MKKLKAIVVSLCLVLALGGCGKSEETYTAEELANMSEKELAEIMEKQEKEEKSDKKNKPGKADEPSQEIMDAEWYSGKVQIGGIVIDLPITTSELVDLGFEYHIPAGLGLTEEYLYGYQELIYITYSLDGKDIFTCYPMVTLEGFHTFEEIVAEQDPVVTSIDSSTVTTGQGIHIFHPGGLQVGDSFTLIEERLGTPTEVDSNMGYHYGTDSVYFPACQNDITVDRTTQKILAIGTKAYTNPTELSMDSLETLTVDNYICNDDSVHNFSMKSFPGAVYDASDQNIKASFILDGQVYSYVMYLGISSYLPDNYTTYILSETDADGVTRTLDEFYEFTVSQNGYYMSGRIRVDNLSTKEANYAYSSEEFTNAIFEIIRSIQLDNM